MKHRDTFTILYGLHLIWTGLWRNIQAAAYKPNALFFCLVLGLVVVVAAFLYRKGKERSARITASIATAIVLTFYLNEFITKPETEASFRVGLIILSSIAQLVVIFLPRRKNA